MLILPFYWSSDQECLPVYAGPDERQAYEAL
jgi:hypothetical protein